jgi:alpha-beta hydrolase superfamily lysophospholipase
MSTEAPATAVDVTLASLDGLPLKAWLWTVSRPRGVVVVAHGLGEHGGAYSHVAESLGKLADVDVLAVDLRGHGRSPGPRGVVEHYEEFCDDLRASIAYAAVERPGLPRFALGHSNGGLVVLRAVLDGGLDVAGLILSNPALRVAAPVPAWKLALGRVMRKVPSLTLDTDVDLNLLTRDPVKVAERRLDPLRHSRINGVIFFGIAEGGETIAERAEEICLPLLLVLGEADPIVDAAFTSQVFERLGSADRTRLVFPEMLHEPLNDLDRAAPLAAIGKWLDDRLPTRGIGAEPPD